MNLFFSKNFNIPSSTSVLCTVSGGQDSQLNLYLFLHLKTFFNLKINLIYCQHFWQAINFYSVFEIFKIGYLFQLPTSILLTQKNLNNEENSRNWRRKTFNRLGQFFSIQNLCFGHTASDQIETSLYNLSRGTSPKGLCSFSNQVKINNSELKFITNNRFNYHYKVHIAKPKNSVKLAEPDLYTKRVLDLTSKDKNNPTQLLKIKLKKEAQLKNFPLQIFFMQTNFLKIYYFRLLKNFHRQEILQLTKNWKLPICADPTNQNITWTRNKIRLEILSYLRKGVNKEIDCHFFQFLSLNSQEQNFFDEIIKQIIYNGFHETPICLKNIPGSIRSTLVKKVVTCYTIREVNYQQIKTFVESINF